MSFFVKAAELILEHKWEHNLPRHCAIVEHKGKMIAYGFNDKKTHTMMLKYRKKPEAIYLHAEIAAIVKALNHFKGDRERLKACSLWVARLYRDGTFGPSKPCSGCRKAIEDFQFKEVHYT